MYLSRTATYAFAKIPVAQVSLQAAAETRPAAKLTSATAGALAFFGIALSGFSLRQMSRNVGSGLF